jgi:porin
MCGTVLIVSLALLTVQMGTVQAAVEPEQPNDLCQRDSLTHDFFGLNEKIVDSGLEFSMGYTQIYQQNAHGGTSTHRRAGRFTGSYDLELNGDLEKLLGIQGGSLYVLTEGSYSNGIDTPSVSSYFGVNGDAAGDRSMDVTQFWYEQSLWDEVLAIRVGKLDMSGGFECHGCRVSFDGCSYANDETSQFLNNALINNPTIPFPDYGLGAIIHYNPVDWWYASLGAADAQADARETGFRTTFYNEDYFVYIFETGITPTWNSPNGPLLGAYRVGIWNDPQPKANSDSEKNYRDDMGIYTTCDQLLVKENDNPEDSQGLGAFFRYGYADGKRNDLHQFWSAGVQYQGLFDGRDEDVLGAGFAHGTFSNAASSTYTEDYESVVEVYYNVRLTKWINLAPSVQYVTDPGGSSENRDAFIAGLRSQITF